MNLLSFADQIMKAIKGEKGITEPTFVYLPGISGGEAIAKETGADYFSVPVELGVSYFIQFCCIFVAKICASRLVLRKPPTLSLTSIRSRRSSSKPALPA